MPTYANTVNSEDLLIGAGRCAATVRYSVFGESQTVDEALLLPEVEKWVKQRNLDAGVPLSAFRVLLGSLGDADASLIACRDITGLVGFGLLPNGGFSYGEPGRHGLCVRADWSSGQSQIYGLAGDEVTGVRVVLGPMAHKCAVKNNAFFLETTCDEAPSIDAIIASLKDARAVSFEFCSDTMNRDLRCDYER
jgi:hypothetical protein